MTIWFFLATLEEIHQYHLNLDNPTFPLCCHMFTLVVSDVVQKLFTLDDNIDHVRSHMEIHECTFM